MRCSKSVGFQLDLGSTLFSSHFYDTHMSNFTSWYRVVQPCGCVDTNTSMLGKRPLVCWSDCLTQSSRWIVFNGNWQQLNSLAPFGGPLLLVFFFYLNSWPSIKALTHVRCQVFFFFLLYYDQKAFCFSLRERKVIPVFAGWKIMVIFLESLHACVQKKSWSINFFPHPDKRSFLVHKWLSRTLF